MSAEAGKRKAVAEIIWGDSKNPVARVGTRTVHHYWALLAPHFRSVWLPPQRQSDDRGVSWTWHQVADAPPVMAAELGDVRQRMTAALDSARDDPSFGSVDAAVIEAVAEVVAGLVQKRDAPLTSFVCRTDAGLRLHSWGSAVAAVPFFPNDLERGVSGVLLVGDKDPTNLEVVLENRKGLVIARARADAAGAFAFKQVSAGSYRVRVVADRVDFPVSGLEVEVGRSSVTGLKLRSTALNIAAEKERAEQAVRRRVAISDEQTDTDTDAARPPPPRKRRPAGAWVWTGVGAAAAVLAGWWFWAKDERSRGSAPEGATFSTAGGGAVASPGEAGRGIGGEAPLVGTAVVSSRRGGKFEPVRGGAVATAIGGGAPRPSSSTPPSAVLSAGPAIGAGTAGAVNRTATAAAPSRDAVAAQPPGANTAGAAAAAGRRAGPGGSRAGPDGAGAVPSSPSMPAAGGAWPGAEAATPAAAAGKPAALPGPEQSASEEASAATPAAPAAAAGTGAKRAGGDNDAAANDAPANASSSPIAKGGGNSGGRNDSTGRGGAGDPEPASPSGGASAALARSDRKGSQAGRGAAENSPAAGGREEQAEAAPAGQGEENPADAPAPSREVPSVPVAPEVGAAPALARVGWLRVSAWKEPETGDEIVPTLPVLADEDDGLEPMRARMLQERRGRGASLLLPLSTWHGIVLTVPGWNGLRWRIPAGADAVETAVREDRAEIGWRAGPEGQAAGFVLEAASGQTVAQVRRLAEGIVEVDMCAGGQAGGWIGVERVAEDPAGLPPEEERRRFSWTRGAGGALPAGWRTDTDWRGGAGRRLDFPLEAGAPRRELGFHDAATAGAMRCEVEMR